MREAGDSDTGRLGGKKAKARKQERRLMGKVDNWGGQRAREEGRIAEGQGSKRSKGTEVSCCTRR